MRCEIPGIVAVVPRQADGAMRLSDLFEPIEYLGQRGRGTLVLERCVVPPDARHVGAIGGGDPSRSRCVGQALSVLAAAEDDKPWAFGESAPSHGGCAPARRSYVRMRGSTGGGMRRFEGKVVLITGAAAGIGRATAERLASEGASLLLCDVAMEGLEETGKRCTALGAAVETRRCDVGSEADVSATVAACIARFGKLDGLANIAGIILLERLEKISLAQFEKVLRVNLTGTFLMCQAALPHLVATKGAIVNTASTSALSGMPYGAAYGTSKGGVLALTRTIAVEYGKQSVRCNAICPGSIKTAMGSNVLPADPDWDLVRRAMPLDKPRGPEVVASVVALLLSEDGIHINGESIRMDAGTLA